MRTTVTLKNDLAKELRDKAHREHRSFKEVINETLQAGLHAQPAKSRKKIVLPTYNMGPPKVDLTKALAIAAEMEDEEIMRKLALGK